MMFYYGSMSILAPLDSYSKPDSLSRMEYITPYKSIVFLGKIASGKGTQADLVLSHFGGVLYSNGNKLRAVAQEPTVFGRKMKEIYESGLLLPEWVATYWMTHALVSQHADDIIVFEAVAKKPHEAETFHQIHADINRAYVVFHLSVPDEVVRRRSEGRARDVVDSPKSVEKRLEEYHMHTEKSVEYFRNQGTLVDIDGTKTPEAIKQDIFKHLCA
jgi:adenylate kinase